MTVKFGYTYQLQVGTSEGSTITIEPPFTVAFDIVRNTLSSANVAQIRIYNLSAKNRNLLRYNQSNLGEFRPVVLRAGYKTAGARLPAIFTGNVSQAWSVREDKTNYVTTIESFDGGFAFVNGIVTRNFPAGTSQRDMIEALVSTLPHVEVGAIGDFPGELSRANAYVGTTTDILNDLTGGAFFIDSGKGNALKTDEYIDKGAGVIVITPASGLLNTPVLERSIVHFDMLFEPGLEPGSQILLDSFTETNFNASKNFNGIYKTTGVKHRGMISESVKSSVITTGEFYFSKLLTPVE